MITVEVKVQTEQLLTPSPCGVEVPLHPVVEGEERCSGSHLCTHVADGGHAWGRGREEKGERGKRWEEIKERRRERENREHKYTHN